MPCPSQGRGVSHPVGTLHRWSSSHPARCSGPTLQGDAPADEARGPRSWPCCAATPRPGPVSTPGWPAACGPGSRTPPTTSWPHAASTHRPSSSGRASCSARSTSRATATTADRPTRLLLARLVHALLRQLVHTGEIRRSAGRRARRRCGPAGTTPTCGQIEALPAAARTALAETLAAPCPQPDRTGPPLRARLDAADQRPRRHPAGGRADRPARDVRPRRRIARSRARRRCARSGCRPADHGRWRGGHCTTCRSSRPSAAARRPFRLALLESASGRYGVEDVREEHLRAIASHLAAWLAAGHHRPWITG